MEDMLGDEILGDDDGLGDEILGDEILGDEDVLGAVRRAVARRRGGMPRGRARALLPGGKAIRQSPPMFQAAPGLSAPSAGKVQILPLGQFQFGPATAAFVIFTARPQIPIRPRRLVIDFTRTGPSATGLLTVTQFQIATRSQLASAGPVPAGAFAPTAFGVGIICDPAAPGVDIVVQIAISALPGAGDSVDVAAMLFCDAVA